MLPEQSRLDQLAAILHAASPSIAVFLYAETVAGGGRLPLPALVQHLLGPHAQVGGAEPIGSEAALLRVRQCLEQGDEQDAPLFSSAALQQFQTTLNAVLNEFATSLEEARLVEQFWLCDGHPAHPDVWDFAFAVRTRNEALLFMGSASSL